MKAQVEFRSRRFHREKREDALVNPGRWGRRLAAFLHAQLASAGFDVGEPEPMDWGWALKVGDAAASGVFVGCGNLDGAEDGFLVFVDRERSVISHLSRWNSNGTAPVEDQLAEEIDRLLQQTEGVSDIFWSDSGET